MTDWLQRLQDRCLEEEEEGEEGEEGDNGRSCERVSQE